MQLHIPTLTHPHTHTHTHTSTHTHPHTHQHTHMHTHMHAHMHTCIHTHTCAHTHTCTHTAHTQHTHTHMHTYTHTHITHTKCIFMNPLIIAECISARLWIEDLFKVHVHTYVLMWWVMLRNVTWNVVTYHRYRPLCASHSLTRLDTLDSDIDCMRRRALAMEMEVGDDSPVGPSQLGYYKHQTAFLQQT